MRARRGDGGPTANATDLWLMHKNPQHQPPHVAGRTPHVLDAPVRQAGGEVRYSLMDQSPMLHVLAACCFAYFLAAC